ncbi:MAG: DUF4465 domain-containing protein [Pirellulaceae bacterium]|nr:DUF4465 domain-containing protein [Pirellulaceae bacterium]
MQTVRFQFLLCLVAILTQVDARAAVVVDLNELPLGPSSSTDSYFDGYGFAAATGSWTSQGVSFKTNQFGPGWSYSNVNNPTTAGFMNQWSAYPGTGFGGSGNYAIGTGYFPNELHFNVPANLNIDSLRISNATYPALFMRDGDAFADKFGGATGNLPDFFKVTFTGFSNLDATGATTGSQEFYLGDYRFANNAQDYIINDWRLIDLTSLGNAASIGLTFSDSYNGTATPYYVAIDSIAFNAVPEPSSLVLLSVGSSAFWRRTRKRFPRTF